MKASSHRVGLLKSILSFQERVKQGYRLLFLFHFFIYHLIPLKDEQAESRSVERKASILYSTGDRVYPKLRGHPPTAPQPLPESKATDMLFWKQSVFIPDLKLVDKKDSAFADSEIPRLILEVTAGNSPAES